LTNDPSDSLTLGRVNLPAQKAAKEKENEGARKDEISHLLEKPHSATISQDQQVLFVQHALLKLGYVVRANGIWNKATQDALAKFQKDNGLTVKKTLTSKLIALLATRSGLESE
jgi:peptidoglycan hydrolase-like protein with peptidoglycan-binding domain